MSGLKDVLRRGWILAFVGASLVLAFACAPPVAEERTGSADPTTMPPGSLSPEGAPPSVVEAFENQNEGSATLEDLRLQYEAARAELEANPDATETRDQFLVVAYMYAETRMYDPSLTPQEKYPESLRIFRDIVAMEPGHDDARAQIQVIEGIYRELGRPIPM